MLNAPRSDLCELDSCIRLRGGEISAVEVRRRPRSPPGWRGRLDGAHDNQAGSRLQALTWRLREEMTDAGVPLPWPHLVAEFDVPANSVVPRIPLAKLLPFSNPLLSVLITLLRWGGRSLR